MSFGGVYLGYVKNEAILIVLFGIGIVLFPYITSIYLKGMNRLEVTENYCVLKNLLLGNTKITYDSIIEWEEFNDVRSLDTWTLLLRTASKKYVIWNYSDIAGYERLKSKLRIGYSGKEKTTYNTNH
jgi:hypothetical protein